MRPDAACRRRCATALFLALQLVAGFLPPGRRAAGTRRDRRRGKMVRVAGTAALPIPGPAPGAPAGRVRRHLRQTRAVRDRAGALPALPGLRPGGRPLADALRPGGVPRHAPRLRLEEHCDRDRGRGPAAAGQRPGLHRRNRALPLAAGTGPARAGGHRRPLRHSPAGGQPHRPGLAALPAAERGGGRDRALAQTRGVRVNDLRRYARCRVNARTRRKADECT
ncbi:MAG: hypothetical protein MZV70_46685 [Desulfobacterales bacterium]|nr:hypothetical protein [Desulfobacterales bacterium]